MIMLGKRQRPPMKKTTSMTEFTLLDLTTFTTTTTAAGVVTPEGGGGGVRINRRNSVDFTDSAHFLKSCSLCNCRLIPGRDIFMYRGDSGFCSLECRQQQIIQDDRKEKASFIPTHTIESSSVNDSSISVAAVSEIMEPIATTVI